MHRDVRDGKRALKMRCLPGSRPPRGGWLAAWDGNIGAAAGWRLGKGGSADGGAADRRVGLEPMEGQCLGIGAALPILVL